MHQSSSFQERVWLIVSAIPCGYVISYGEIARLAGSPRAARQVAKILKHLPNGSTLPWHRIINSQGKISLKGEDLVRQRNALLAEGVVVTTSGRIDLKLYRWRQ